MHFSFTSSITTAAIAVTFAVQISAVPNGSSIIRCKLPNDPLIVPITPNARNQGWAMSVDQECKPGMYCPYACAPGYFSRQWNPQSTIKENTMDGGLICKDNGSLQKPFPSEPYCVAGLKNVNIVNKLAKSVSACQTVYPGNEEMLIPTVVASGKQAAINVPSTAYWQKTSAQYYINPAGTNKDQCRWGNASMPVGNWAPFVFGAGEGMEDVTFVSVRYNPDYERAGQQTSKAYNVRIECEDPSKCNGLPCQCANGKCTQENGCTIAVRKGGKASFVLYGKDTIGYTPSLHDSSTPVIPVHEVSGDTNEVSLKSDDENNDDAPITMTNGTTMVEGRSSTSNNASSSSSSTSGLSSSCQILGIPFLLTYTTYMIPLALSLLFV